MNLSNMIANLILDMLEDEGQTEIQRNELAQQVGCVPSQINYVISSRFTPEHGYIVESRRGGGGYIRITRASYDNNDASLMHVINNIGNELDDKTCRAHICNLNYQEIIDSHDAKLMLAAVSESSLKQVAPAQRDKVRAAIFKQLLLAEM
ncbi:MAG: CtsR family transcriptional regulator [Acutalibacteraceae bacterium]|nr:CtsR family transcriptional regulator [Clostridiales bacterium]